MTHVEVWLMALALAMDCFAVAIASGIFFKKVYWKPMLTMAFLFGFFQALNPFLGWWGTDLCRTLIESVDHWVAFGILGFMGARMIIESFKEEEQKRFNPRRYKVILTLAIATSIDALAVGVTMAFLDVNIWIAATVIGVITFALSAVGVVLGYRFGTLLGSKAGLLGGVILIGLGVKIILEHLGIIAL